ncbi:transcriptional regulator, partial [Mesorhizobium sp. M1C.F.Ca.ET.212.01.1.1]
PDIPFDQDGTRVGAAFRAQQHAWYVRELQARGVDYVLLEGDLETRIARVQRELATRADNRFSVAQPL